MSKKNSVQGELPVTAFREQILGAVAGSAVTVITAETGAGKSTQVPQFLAGAGYRVIVTQPRRLAARTLAQRVAEEMNTRLGDRVGFRTAEERADSASTEVLFVTDGLQLVRELAGQGGTGRKTVLVLDEVHEWNLNVETLVAWVKTRLSAGDDLKVVLMSATLDAERLAAFYGGAPVIEVPGRLFPVTRRSAPARSLVAEAVALAKAGRNVLVFQPGKKEIEDTMSSLRQELGGAAIVLPLHGGLEPGEQKLCFAPPPAGKTKVVVSTNVAQTSVTIPDIDAVVDSGIERRVELVDGIEGLYLRPTSQADGRQRAGRAGRTKPGEYVLCSDTGEADRRPFPVAEILRSRLDQLVLRLAAQGFDATTLEFFHQPDHTVLVEAKRALVALGAMSVDGTVTQMGRKMARLPVAVQYARMLIEAEKRGVVAQVATIAACLEAGDIRAKDGGWRSLTREAKSDLLALLDVYNAGQQMKGGGDVLRNVGIFVKDFFRAKEMRGKLLDAVRGSVRSDARKFASVEEERREILRACVAGLVDHLYQGGGGSYRNGDRVSRDLARESVVSGGAWLVGLPKDIEIQTRRGRTTLRLVTMATAVDPLWLADVAPQLVERKMGLNPWYNPEKDICVSTTQVFFNGRLIADEPVLDPHHPEATRLFATWFATEQMRDANLERAKALNLRAGETVFPVRNREEMLAWATQQLAGARRLEEIKNPTSLIIPEPDAELATLVMEENPDQISLLGKSVTVEYYEDRAPRVTLDRETAAAHGWRDLPNTGVKLPGGRLVEIAVPFGYYETISGQDIPELKARCASKANQGLWNNWWDRPAFALPDPADPTAVVPEIIEYQYGISVIDGTPLVAFGTVALNAYHYYSSDPWFKSEWYQVREEAAAARTNAIAKLEELRKEAIEQKRLEDERRETEAKAQAEIAAAKTEAEAVKAELKALTSNELCSADNELYHRAYAESGCYSWLPSTAEELRAWTVKTRAIIVQVQAVLADFQRQQEAEAQAKAEAERLARAELGVILEATCLESLERAAEIKAFAQEVERIKGTRQGLEILRNELEAPYGRGGRQNGVEHGIRGIADTDMGSRFLRFHRAADVNTWLAGAVAWLESKPVKGAEIKQKAKHPAPPPVETTPAAPAQVAATLDALKARFGGKTSRR